MKPQSFTQIFIGLSLFLGSGLIPVRAEEAVTIDCKGTDSSQSSMKFVATFVYRKNKGTLYQEFREAILNDQNLTSILTVKGRDHKKYDYAILHAGPDADFIQRKKLFSTALSGCEEPHFYIPYYPYFRSNDWAFLSEKDVAALNRSHNQIELSCNETRENPINFKCAISLLFL